MAYRLLAAKCVGVLMNSVAEKQVRLVSNRSDAAGCIEP